MYWVVLFYVVLIIKKIVGKNHFSVLKFSDFAFKKRKKWGICKTFYSLLQKI